jgi:hypothetical protein
VRATVDAVAQRRCVSAVVGEPQIQPEALARAAATIVDAGASYVKLSLYALSAQEDCVRALSYSWTRRVSLMESHLPINDQTTRSSGSWRKAALPVLWSIPPARTAAAFSIVWISP